MWRFKILLLLATAMCCLTGAYAVGKPLGDAEKTMVLQRLDCDNISIKTVRCDFKQVRHSDMMEKDLISSGKVRIDFPSHIEIEMLEPYKNKIILDPGKSNKSSNQAVSAIVPLVSGGMASNKCFLIEVQEIDDQWKICLEPVEAGMKAYVSSVTLIVGKEDCIVRSMEMCDTDGGYTRMDFSNVIIVR